MLKNGVMKFHSTETSDLGQTETSDCPTDKTRMFLPAILARVLTVFVQSRTEFRLFRHPRRRETVEI